MRQFREFNPALYLLYREPRVRNEAAGGGGGGVAEAVPPAANRRVVARRVGDIERSNHAKHRVANGLKAQTVIAGPSPLRDHHGCPVLHDHRGHSALHDGSTISPPVSATVVAWCSASWPGSAARFSRNRRCAGWWWGRSRVCHTIERAPRWTVREGRSSTTVDYFALWIPRFCAGVFGNTLGRLKCGDSRSTSPARICLLCCELPIL